MKRFTFLVLIFLGFNFSLLGQTQKEKENIKIDLSFTDSIIIPPTEIQREIEDEEIIFCISNEQPATFEGGMDNFYKIVSKNLRSVDDKVGRVFVQFLVDTTGKTSEIKIMKGLSEKSDAEVLRLINWLNSTYSWIPATQRGKKIKVRMSIPIVFKRENTIPTEIFPIQEAELFSGCNLPIDSDSTEIEIEEQNDKIYTIVETAAVFEGGMDNFYKIVMKNLNVTKDTQMGTRIFIQFVIDTTGKMTDFKILKSISPESSKEVLRVMNLINEKYSWKPAQIGTKKVKVRMNFPIIMHFEN